PCALPTPRLLSEQDTVGGDREIAEARLVRQQPDERCEPLLRRDLPALIRLLADKPRLRDLAITTNGVLLAEQASSLKEAGLHRVTVSLDTLRPDRFTALTRRANHAQVLAVTAAAPAAGVAGA